LITPLTQEFVSEHRGTVQWQVRADARAVLLDDRGLRLDEWLALGSARVVKSGPHRTVYRVQLPERTIYVKHYRVADLRATLSQWAQGSKARREWQQIRKAAAFRVPTPEVLAVGEVRRAGFVFGNFLITEGIDSVEPLDRFLDAQLRTLPRPEQSRVRRQLAVRLAELVAHAHQAGLLHEDLHAGNVLVRLRDDGAVETFLIDLHAARMVRRLSWRQARANLLQFGIYFLDAATRTERWRFLRRYLELRPELGRDVRTEAARLCDELWCTALHFWRRRDARCMTNNRRFYFRDIATAHGHSVSELSEATFLALLRDPDAAFQRNATLIKSSGSSTVARITLDVDGRPTEVIYKRFRCCKWLDPLRALFGRSPALRAWQAGHALLLRGIATPRPLAVMERTPRALVRDSYLITEAVPRAHTLHEYLEQLGQRPPREQRATRRSLADRLGRLLRRLHERRISHRDLKSVNLLAAQSAETGVPDLLVIDLAGAQLWRRLPFFRRRQNLARLFASLRTCAGVQRTDALRFLRAYLPGGLADAAQWKSLWRAVRRRVREKLAQNQRRGRPVT
jgi:tRNA A-37 threonylcarbamoyl transferase component Bud32